MLQLMKTSEVTLVEEWVLGSGLNSPENMGMHVYLVHKKRHI